jgi:hypothetical protein
MLGTNKWINATKTAHVDVSEINKKMPAVLDQFKTIKIN